MALQVSDGVYSWAHCRAARNSARPAIAKSPPAKKQLQARHKPATPLHNLEDDDDDLVLVDSDDETEVARKAAAKRALAQEESQLFGLESQSLPDRPSLTNSTTPAQACLAAPWLCATILHKILFVSI